MRKIASLLVALLSVSLISCNRINGEKDMKKMVRPYYPIPEKVCGFKIDDTTDISAIQDMEYEYDELIEFFDGSFFISNFSDGSFSNEKGSGSKSIEYVNSRFPIRVLRSELYTMYKVKDGGVFYVFFAGNKKFEYLNVFSVLYIAEKRNLNYFNGIKENIATAADLNQIDPFASCVLFMNSRTFSGSLLDANTVLEIDYDIIQGEDSSIGMKNYLVTSKKVVPRKQSVSFYGIIQDKDILI